MKKIVIVALIILLIYLLKGENEPFVDERLFNEVEIPDFSKDPYYQRIKNIDFPCMCGEGKEKNSKGECVDVCPSGQTRFTDDRCYPSCPEGQMRHTNAICYPPCPSDQFRNPNGLCQCVQKQPQTYDLTINADIQGNDIKIIKNPSGLVWANGCRLECNNNPDCKAYNVIHRGGVWGDDWGCALKRTSAIPTPGYTKIDYYRKIETVKNSNGVCVVECPGDKTRDANGTCQWNACPSEQTRDGAGNCQWNPCPSDQTRDSNGVCQCIQQPVYQKYINKDVPGNDIRCIDKPSNFEGCKLECNKDPNCKGYNLIYKDGAWGAGWGCCLKNTTSIPTANANKIDYFKRLEGTITKDRNGLCNVPCEPEKTRDVNGICQWDPCPADKTRDGAGNCQWNPCPIPDNRRLNSGECLCPEGYGRAMGKTSNTDPCFKSCGFGAVLNEDGVCRCTPPYVGDGEGGCKLPEGTDGYSFLSASNLSLDGFM